MIETLLTTARDRMKKSIDITRNDLSSIRSGRATPALVEHIIISAYGGTQRLQLMEMSTITSQDARTLVITPYDPSQIHDIEHGIQEANRGFTPVVDGEIIRITIPSLSEERRQEYIKLAHAKLESGKIMIRQIRQDAMKDVKKMEEGKQITEDDLKHAEKRIQETTDQMIRELEDLGQKKEQELMQV